MVVGETMIMPPPPELPLLPATLEFRRRQRLTSKPHHPSTYSQFIKTMPRILPFRAVTESSGELNPFNA